MERGEGGTPVVEVCREAGTGPATYFSWRKTGAGLLADGMRRPTALEDGNGRLTKVVAELTLDRARPRGA